MTCKRLLVPTKRGSCSHPQPLSHTALGGGLLPALPKPCWASSSSVHPLLLLLQRRKRGKYLPQVPHWLNPACLRAKVTWMVLQTLLQGYLRLLI